MFFAKESKFLFPETKIMFGSQKVLRWEENTIENVFPMFGSAMDNTKQNQIWQNLLEANVLVNLFNHFMDKLKWVKSVWTSK